MTSTLGFRRDLLPPKWARVNLARQTRKRVDEENSSTSLRSESLASYARRVWNSSKQHLGPSRIPRWFADICDVPFKLFRRKVKDLTPNQQLKCLAVRMRYASEVQYRDGLKGFTNLPQTVPALRKLAWESRMSLPDLVGTMTSNIGARPRVSKRAWDKVLCGALRTFVQLASNHFRVAGLARNRLPPMTGDLDCYISNLGDDDYSSFDDDDV